MKTYCDTSLLLATYLPEPATDVAIEIVHSILPPVPLSHLLELELRTAIRVKHGRGQVSMGTLCGALQAMESDLANGVLVRPQYDLEAVFLRAETISAKHAAATLARTADIWHVAAAWEVGCKSLASFDERQRQIARLCGLEVIPESVPSSTPKTRKKHSK